MSGDWNNKKVTNNLIQRQPMKMDLMIYFFYLGGLLQNMFYLFGLNFVLYTFEQF